MFNQKYKLFRLSGFEVGVDPSWILLAFLVAWSLSTGYFPFKYQNLSSGQYWLMGIVGALGLFLSIIAHEFCHSIVARRTGMPMKGITLFIFGGVAEMGQEPANARDEFFIAVVGPISSFLIAGAFYALNVMGESAGWPVALYGITGYLGMINIILAIFNLVPAFPWTGVEFSARGFGPGKNNLRWATRVASRCGEGFGIILIVLGALRIMGGLLIGGMWFIPIGLFIRSAAKMSYHQMLARRLLEGEGLRRFMNTDPVTVSPYTTLVSFLEDYVYRYHHKLYPVVENGRLVGCISTRQLKETPREEWKRKTVGEASVKCDEDNTVKPDTDAVDVLSSMRKNGSGRLIVAEDNHLKGIIALKDLLDFLSMKIELEEEAA